ncbi:LLM class flavin-dependent oxidoreductase [Thalassotalea euphylliae]|uniref:LLM class flavin-dependent oxidoreductase n=1 Tax=Thalassotalea euphylliae TaxID=1655234 RepID=A0A3E0TYG3_9GAMM|nr:LLM class flavin-dependent oxidoreductase [Thalassotalea euphylliae]REL29490.1 LLM class flavin-dependent oxidoreductase [Thalassotalea euphylliae]
MNFKLSVLDQSFARTFDSATTALKETIEMAQFCEQLGYHRFWISEHHGFVALAGSAPEVLLSALGAATNKIRLGSGGIMLPHYSSYKVAEVFSMLANLYPERIDLGIGRAPGTDMLTASALAPNGRPDFHKFPQQVEELWHYLNNENAEPTVSPKPPKDLPMWMLGSSQDSAVLAAQHGLPYNLALFINPHASAQVTNYYQQHFKPSAKHETPYTSVTIATFCAEDEDYAHLLAKSYEVNYYRYITGEWQGDFLTPEQVAEYPVPPQLSAFIQQRLPRRAIGTPAQVKANIEEIQAQFDADEVMMISNVYHFEDRKKSFELVKKAFS